MVAGISSSAIAATITRLRPSTSESTPVNGAVAATASVPAVMTMLASAAPTPNSLRHHRQHRLRRIEVQERADGAEGDGDAARIGKHARRHCPCGGLLVLTTRDVDAPPS